MTDAGVTVVITRTVKAGRERDYEAWLHDVTTESAKFPGHLGMTVFRPTRGSREYTIVFRFATEEQLAAWESSPERAAWLSRAAPLVERAQVFRQTGLETWFAAPDTPMLPSAAPPKWKMVAVTWCVAFPLIQIYGRTIGLLAIHPLARGALVGLAMVLTMTYVAMPFASKLLRRWLYATRATS